MQSHPHPDKLRQLQHSRSIGDHQRYLRFGAEIEDPIHCIMYREELAAETYEKIFIDEDGSCGVTTCPAGLLLGTDGWRLWQLKGANFSVYIGYDPKATMVNPFWYSLREPHRNCDKIPVMKGVLVVFRWHRPIGYTPLELRRELNNYLVMRFLQSSSYNFSP